jgi:hypothetical protein
MRLVENATIQRQARIARAREEKTVLVLNEDRALKDDLARLTPRYQAGGRCAIGLVSDTRYALAIVRTIISKTRSENEEAGRGIPDEHTESHSEVVVFVELETRSEPRYRIRGHVESTDSPLEWKPTFVKTHLDRVGIRAAR